MKFKILKLKEMIELLKCTNTTPVLVVGFANYKKKQLNLLYSNFKFVKVSFDVFKPSGDGTIPDFVKFSIEDYGQTIALGNYEVNSSLYLNS